MPDVRVAQVSILVNGSGASGSVVLQMPFIEGHTHQVLEVQFDQDVVEAGQDIVVGLSHLLGPNTPSGYRAFWDDENVWIHQQFGDAENTYRIDFSNRDFQIAGPQQFQVFNGGGAAHEYSCRMWYVTKNIPFTQWANLATLTSHED